jgi:type IV secretion system protein TrbJ
MKKAAVLRLALLLVVVATGIESDAGVVAGFATEWTQILNHVQLMQSYIRQGLQLENELSRYELALKESLVEPKQIFGPIDRDLTQLAQLVQGGRALAYSMANLDAQFRNTFPGYAFRTQGYYESYQKWSEASLDTALNSLKAAGFHGQQLETQQAILGALRAQSTAAGGEVQAIEVGNEIAEQQVEQLMALRQLMLVDLESKQAYQAEQIQKEQAATAAGQQFFTNEPLVTDQKKY